MGAANKILAQVIAGVLIVALAAFILNLILTPPGHDGGTKLAPSNRAASENVAPAGQDEGTKVSTSNDVIIGDAAAKDVPLASVAPPNLHADEKVATVEIPGITQPPLELERQKAEKSAKNADSVRISTGFECSTPLEVKKLSASHFLVTLTSSELKDWFMFRMEGVAGKTVRVDLAGKNEVDQASINCWVSLNPVFTYARDLDDPGTYSSDEKDNGIVPSMAWNDPLLPATTGQQWHFIANAWLDGQTSNVFSFVQHFDYDSAYVAMRIPHPPGYNEQFFHQLSSNPLAKVYEVGRSQGNRPLLLAKIGSGGDEAEKQKPCVLFYAAEHADEPDAMWTAQGVVEYLLGDTPAAKNLRDRFTFLVIPMLDPDASAAGLHMGIIPTFITQVKTPESIAYANWFQAWVNAGKRLDVIFDFHNVQSKEQPPVSCSMLEGLGVRAKSSVALHLLVVKNLQQAGLGVNPQPWQRGWSPDRLGGWLSRRFGPVTLAYEMNSQAADRHLNLGQEKAIGGIFADAIPEFFSSPDGAAILADVDARRQERLARLAKHGPVRAGIDAIEAETEVSKGVGLPTNNKELLVEKWVY